MSDIATQPMHSFVHKRNEQKIKEAEKELQELLGNETEADQEESSSEGTEKPVQELSDEGDTKQKEADTKAKAQEDTSNLTGEEKSFKKRYGDIQRHMATKKKSGLQG